VASKKGLAQLLCPSGFSGLSTLHNLFIKGKLYLNCQGILYWTLDLNQRSSVLNVIFTSKSCTGIRYPVRKSVLVFPSNRKAVEYLKFDLRNMHRQGPIALEVSSLLGK
jgi:hypothetical protein